MYHSTDHIFSTLENLRDGENQNFYHLKNVFENAGIKGMDFDFDLHNSDNPEFIETFLRVQLVNLAKKTNFKLTAEEYEKMTMGQQLFMQIDPIENIPALLSLPPEDRPTCGGMG